MRCRDDDCRSRDPGAPVVIGPADRCRFCGPGNLTMQESAVGRLLAQGRTDREIAAELFISAVTVRSVVAHLCAKLGVESSQALVRGGTEVDRSRRSASTAAGDCRMRVDPDPAVPTQQEAEVGRLVRQGWTERAIAAELFISVAAVRANLAHLQAKVDQALPDAEFLDPPIG